MTKLPYVSITINMLGKASDNAYLIVGKLNICYSPDDKIKEVHKNLPVRVKTNYVGFENENNDKLEESVIVILFALFQSICSSQLQFHQFV